MCTVYTVQKITDLAIVFFAEFLIEETHLPNIGDLNHKNLNIKFAIFIHLDPVQTLREI